MAEVVPAVAALGNLIGLLNSSRTLFGTVSEMISELKGVDDKIQELSEEVELIQDQDREGPSQWLLEDARLDVKELLGRLARSASRINKVSKKEEIEESIRKLSTGIDKLNRLAPQHVASRLTESSVRRVKDLLGYSQQRIDLECLLKDSTSAHPVVGIIGPAGMGKTELARWAFNHDYVKKRFVVRIWVGVSGNLSKNGLSCEILEGPDSRPKHLDLKDVTELGKKLTDKLGVGPSKQKKCLLVLDDVSYHESAPSQQSRANTWDAVRIPFLQHGGSGSRILVTTRAQICLGTLGATDEASIDLGDGIDDAAIIKLLKMTAFGDARAAIPAGLDVRKLGGSPWVATEVGLIMKGSRSRSTAEWNRALRSSCLPDHVSSYKDLPVRLKRCFAFCSIFPDGWEFERGKLAMMWVAHGFVTEEEAARQCIEGLLQRSLFRASGEEKDRYVINKHIHSMIRRVEVATKYHLMIDGTGEEALHPTARHLSCTTDSRCLDKIIAYPDAWKKKVRTLLLYSKDTHSGAASSSTDAIDQILLDKLLKRFKGVKVLDFSRTTGITQLPNSITGLKNVRYLGLPNNIQVSDPCFNELNLLRTLEGRINFIAEGSMSQLEKLHARVSDLNIQGLETVKSKDKAKRAKIEEKKHLKVLMLEWDYKSPEEALKSVDSNLEVLRVLQPAPSIQTLSVTGYQGTRLPSWLKNPDVLKHLSSLYLNKCTNLVTRDLLDVGGLPLLRFLQINRLPAVTRINTAFCNSGAFPALEELELTNMNNLKEWEADPRHGGVILFRKLKKVKILNCSKLSALQGLRSCRKSLVYLTVTSCPILSQSFDRIDFPKLTKESRKRVEKKCPGLQFN